MELDEIYKQIINILYNYGRESLTSIGEKVHKADKDKMSHTGVNKRLTKLEKLNLLKVQGNVNISKLDYKACYILIELKNFESIKSIIKSYEKCPRVFLLNQVSGRYNLILGIVGQNTEILQRYINHCGPTNKEGILHSDILFVSDFVIPPYIPINLFGKESYECNCGNICSNCSALLEGNCEGCGNF
ncbi:MAG: hypothetical protein GF316_18645 [Candidatus Lokiarchaeota archaeon]|nr:hypothetical protein [Candidatus Lokiarchaeota archaeon]